MEAVHFSVKLQLLHRQRLPTLSLLLHLHQVSSLRLQIYLHILLLLHIPNRNLTYLLLPHPIFHQRRLRCHKRFPPRCSPILLNPFSPLLRSSHQRRNSAGVLVTIPHALSYLLIFKRTPHLLPIPHLRFTPRHLPCLLTHGLRLLSLNRSFLIKLRCSYHIHRALRLASVVIHARV